MIWSFHLLLNPKANLYRLQSEPKPNELGPHASTMPQKIETLPCLKKYI